MAAAKPGRGSVMSSHLLDESAKGVFIIAATPFADDGALDLDSLARMIDFYVGVGVHGLTVLGMMGEAHKLTYEESCLVVEHTLRHVAGALPVVVCAPDPDGARSVGPAHRA